MNSKILSNFADSVKYYRDKDGFVYEKCGENPKTLYLDCLREPLCIAGARFYKDSGELVVLSTHSDEKPDEHLVHKIAFEEFLKIEVRKKENVHVSALNLYKRAMNSRFKGIWLPPNHQTSFLQKLRRIRDYEIKEKKNAACQNKVDIPAVQMADIATSPMSFQCLTPFRIYPAENCFQNDGWLNLEAPNTLILPPPSVFQDGSSVTFAQNEMLSLSTIVIEPIISPNIQPPTQFEDNMPPLLEIFSIESQDEARALSSALQLMHLDGDIMPILPPPIQLESATPISSAENHIQHEIIHSKMSTDLPSQNQLIDVRSMNKISVAQPMVCLINFLYSTKNILDQNHFFYCNRLFFRLFLLGNSTLWK